MSFHRTSRLTLSSSPPFVLLTITPLVLQYIMYCACNVFCFASGSHPDDFTTFTSLFASLSSPSTISLWPKTQKVTNVHGRMLRRWECGIWNWQQGCMGMRQWLASPCLPPLRVKWPRFPSLALKLTNSSFSKSTWNFERTKRVIRISKAPLWDNAMLSQEPILLDVFSNSDSWQ